MLITLDGFDKEVEKRVNDIAHYFILAHNARAVVNNMFTKAGVVIALDVDLPPNDTLTFPSTAPFHIAFIDTRKMKVTVFYNPFWMNEGKPQS